jgi:hypothetical protein
MNYEDPSRIEPTQSLDRYAQCDDEQILGAQPGFKQYEFSETVSILLYSTLNWMHWSSDARIVHSQKYSGGTHVKTWKKHVTMTNEKKNYLPTPNFWGRYRKQHYNFLGLEERVFMLLLHSPLNRNRFRRESR